MQKQRIEELQQITLRVRERIIRMSVNGGSFIGASFSCVDFIVYLYKEFLNVNKSNLNDPNRDYFFMSKGHDVPALYGLFVELGFLSEERLINHLKPEDFIYWHPNVNIPGIEFHSGSLGHLLSVALGVALDCKIQRAKNKIIVVLGDGELNEGSNWEAALVAASKKLDNLIAVVDRNKFQANAETEDIIKLEPLAEKFKSFGWGVRTVNGHDFRDIKKAFTRLPIVNGRPNLVIANTIRGKGLPSIESRVDKWFAEFTPEEAEKLKEELKSEANKEMKYEV
ncbi:MAG: transketolase [Ignavibacteriae bacterium]|nr:transketolase [Ignavibacteriota bacterium]